MNDLEFGTVGGHFLGKSLDHGPAQLLVVAAVAVENALEHPGVVLLHLHVDHRGQHLAVPPPAALISRRIVKMFVGQQRPVLKVAQCFGHLFGRQHRHVDQADAVAFKNEARLGKRQSGAGIIERPQQVEITLQVFGLESHDHHMRCEGLALHRIPQHGLIQAIATDAKIEDLDPDARGPETFFQLSAQGIFIGHVITVGEGIAKQGDAQHTRIRLCRILHRRAHTLTVVAVKPIAGLGPRTRRPTQVLVINHHRLFARLQLPDRLLDLGHGQVVGPDDPVPEDKIAGGIELANAADNNFGHTETQDRHRQQEHDFGK